MTALALSRLRKTWYVRAGIEDIERDTANGNMLLHEVGSRSEDARDIAFAGDMAAAARAILDHPALDERERDIWHGYCEGYTYAELAARARCSFRAVSAAIDRAQALMLRPRWEEYDMRPPKKAPPPEAFTDVETSIQIGMENAHRKIVEIHGKPVLDSDDVLDNDRAVHTMLAARRSELEYLRGKLPAYPRASDDDVRSLIDRETGKVP